MLNVSLDDFPLKHLWKKSFQVIIMKLIKQCFSFLIHIKQ